MFRVCPVTWAGAWGGSPRALPACASRLANSGGNSGASLLFGRRPRPPGSRPGAVGACVGGKQCRGRHACHSCLEACLIACRRQRLGFAKESWKESWSVVGAGATATHAAVYSSAASSSAPSASASTAGRGRARPRRPGEPRGSGQGAACRPGRAPGRRGLQPGAPPPCLPPRGARRTRGGAEDEELGGGGHRDAVEVARARDGVGARVAEHEPVADAQLREARRPCRRSRRCRRWGPTAWTRSSAPSPPGAAAAARERRHAGRGVWPS